MAKLVAHRGASAQATENTIAAFNLAIKLRAEIIEFDVHQTRDGVLIVHHNSDLDGQPISDLDHQEIAANPHNEHIPTLLQTLQSIAGRIKLYVEIKTPGCEQAVIDMLRTYVTPQDFAIISFDDEILCRVKDYDPDVRTGLLLVHKIDGKLAIRRKDVFHMRRIRNSRADFIAPRCIPILLTSLAYAYAYNIPLYVWTINSPTLYHVIGKFKKVETIASDVPPSMTPDHLDHIAYRHWLKHFLHLTPS